MKLLKILQSEFTKKQLLIKAPSALLDILECKCRQRLKDSSYWKKLYQRLGGSSVCFFFFCSLFLPAVTAGMRRTASCALRHFNHSHLPGGWQPFWNSPAKSGAGWFESSGGLCRYSRLYCRHFPHDIKAIRELILNNDLLCHLDIGT